MITLAIRFRGCIPHQRYRLLRREHRFAATLQRTATEGNSLPASRGVDSVDARGVVQLPGCLRQLLENCGFEGLGGAITCGLQLEKLRFTGAGVDKFGAQHL